MVPKKIDIRTSKNGEFIESLCVNSASTSDLQAVLTLCEPDSEVLIIVKSVTPDEVAKKINMTHE